MDTNISTPRFVSSMQFDSGSAIPPYPHPHSMPGQQPPHPHPAPQPSPFGLSNNQRFDANWFANFPPPPPPPPQFGQVAPHPPFDQTGAPLFPQIPFIPPTNSIPPQTAIAQTHDLQEKPPTPSRDRAKEAILSLVRADITYNDLVNEGVQAALLTTLFAELKIPLPRRTAEPTEAFDPAMERKDRIAKLLAAKKSQNAAASPKEHTQTNEVVVTPDGVSRNHTPLPTIMKEVSRERNPSDFSIPGLFMTSAEQEEIIPFVSPLIDIDIVDAEQARATTQNDDQIPPHEASAIPVVHEQPTEIFAEVEPQSKLKQSQSHPNIVEVETRSSLKRGPEPFSTNVMPQPKRQVSESQVPVLHSDPVKVSDLGINAVRSKVNQNILKDRMAALKADLLLKNSRKKALQDGMPVLNAEVQKTRERLQDNQSRLRLIRKDIETKAGELTRLKDEEALLQEEVQRLENQLEDGESGQQQFSRELTQLNDQIMADENESRASQNPSLLRSPAVARIDDTSQPHIPSHEVITAPLAAQLKSPQAQREPDPDVDSDRSPLVQANDDIQTTETEYSPEQEDVDRQLNVEVGYGGTQTSHEESLTSTHPHIEMGSQRVSTTAATSEMESDRDSEDDRMSIDEASDEESVGSASMSDSGSDEYEPPIHLDPTIDLEEKDADDYEPHDEVADPEDFRHEADNDDYEPSERVDVLNVESLEDLRRAEQNSKVSTVEDSILESGVEQQAQVSESAATPSPQMSGKQTSPAPTPEIFDERTTVVNIVEPLSNSHESLPSMPHFVPYSSPLSNMKQFRFNPHFNDVVKNGYRSLTYSHQIDKDVPLCPTELSGIPCVDGSCEEQHFSRIALSDDKILVQMSSANHIKDKGQRDGYLIGLKKVIADLRERGVKEFGEVANALAAYRREQAISQNGLFA